MLKRHFLSATKIRRFLEREKAGSGQAQNVTVLRVSAKSESRRIDPIIIKKLLWRSGVTRKLRNWGAVITTEMKNALEPFRKKHHESDAQ